MKRRIFVAIPVPETIKAEIVIWQKKHTRIQVRWIKPENLHITMVPPWYVAEDELYEVTKVIMEVAQKVKPFPIRFEKILFGPPGQSPRLIWSEGETPKEFGELKEKLENALLANPKTGFWKKVPRSLTATGMAAAESDLAKKRPDILHLTIARFRLGSVKKVPLDGAVDWRFEANSIALMESRLQRTGAEYTVLQSFEWK